MAFEIAEGLHPDLMPIAWLVGRWEGTGKATYPETEDFDFGQQVDFAHNGGPYLHYLSQIFEMDAEGHAVRAAGHGDRILAPAARRQAGGGALPPGRLRRSLVRHVAGAKIELSTDAVVRTASAEDYSAGQRLYGTVEGDLLWTFDKAAAGHPLQSHMWARLRRV